jgi:hypothetical protein
MPTPREFRVRYTHLASLSQLVSDPYSSLEAALQAARGLLQAGCLPREILGDQEIVLWGPELGRALGIPPPTDVAADLDRDPEHKEMTAGYVIAAVLLGLGIVLFLVW